MKKALLITALLFPSFAYADCIGAYCNEGYRSMTNPPSQTQPAPYRRGYDAQSGNRGLTPYRAPNTYQRDPAPIIGRPAQDHNRGLTKTPRTIYDRQGAGSLNR